MKCEALTSSALPQGETDPSLFGNEEEGAFVAKMEGHEGPADPDAPEGDNNNAGGKRKRRKKRQLYSDICKQMEFYFSDANITKNRLMLEMVRGTEYAKLEEFLGFNRISMMTDKVEDIKKALVSSEKLDLSPDGLGVKRKVPYDPDKLKSDQEVEECTVYVENVPRHADHAWLEKVFLSFGPIAYISMPKFRMSGQPKGFAFIEFEKKENAQGCVEAYQGEGAVISGDIDPAELMSVKTFNEEQEMSKAPTKKEKKAASAKKDQAEDTANSRKRKGDDGGEDSDPDHNAAKRLKEEPDEKEDDGQDSAPSESPDSITSVEKPSKGLGVKEKKGGSVEINEGEDESSNKRNRKRRKNKFAKTAEEKIEVEAIHLRVMPKKLWRQLRNRYLNLQRQNMSKLKQQLKDHRLRSQHYKNCPIPERSVPQAGNIVYLQLEAPAESVDSFKNQVQLELAGQSAEEAEISQFIKYIDYEEGASEAYVRFNDDECFQERMQMFVSNAAKVLRSARMLNAQECLEYKLRVQEALKNKKKNVPRKKERGKDRLLRIAGKASQHIRFDEGMDENVGVVPQTQLCDKDSQGSNEAEEPESTTD